MEKTQNSDVEEKSVQTEAEHTDSTHYKNIDRLLDVEVDFSVEVGYVHLSLKEVMSLKKDDIVALDKVIDDSFDIKINNNKVAEGQVVESEKQLFVKVTKVIDEVKND